MNSHLALYDPAHVSVGGHYWTWWHPCLSASLRDRFYYEVAVGHLPANPNQLAPDDLHGGCVALDGTWLCWYRFVNGGRDPRGRPGRFVILTAFIARSETEGRDGSGVLDSPGFRRLAAQAMIACPIPAPDSLEMEWDAPSISCDPVRVAPCHQDSPIVLRGCDAFRQAAELCACWPRHRQFVCQLTRQGDHTQALIRPVQAPAPSSSVIPSTERRMNVISEVPSRGRKLTAAFKQGAIDPESRSTAGKARWPAHGRYSLFAWLGRPVTWPRWMIFMGCAACLVLGVGLGQIGRLWPSPVGASASQPATLRQTPTQPFDSNQ